VGFAFFLVLIGVQATLGVADLAFAAIVGTPESRSRDFADLVSRRPELKNAILIGDPDYMLEPMQCIVICIICPTRRISSGSSVTANMSTSRARPGLK
jgi:hypothetical protein